MLCRLSRDSPDQIKHSFSAVCSDLRRFHQTLHCSPPPKRQHPHKSHSRQQPSSVFFSLSLPPSLWLCRCRQNTEVIIEMSLKEQELDLLGLMAVLKRQATTCDSKPAQAFGTHPGESDKGQDPCGCSLDWTKPICPGLGRLHRLHVHNILCYPCLRV